MPKSKIIHPLFLLALFSTLNACNRLSCNTHQMKSKDIFYIYRISKRHNKKSMLEKKKKIESLYNVKYMKKLNVPVNVCSVIINYIFISEESEKFIKNICENKYERSIGEMNDEGFTPIQQAAKEGNLQYVSLIGMHSKADLGKKTGYENIILDFDGFTPLHLSIYGGHEKVAKYISSLLPGAIAEKVGPYNQEGWSGFRPSHMAADLDRKEILMHILNKFPEEITKKVGFENQIGWVGLTVLDLAAYWGYLEIVEFILSNFPYAIKVKVGSENRTGLGGYSAIHIAVCNGHKNVVEHISSNFPGELIRKVGSENQGWGSEGLTSLHLAAYQGNLDLVKFISNKNPGTIVTKVISESKRSWRGYTPFDIAVKRKHKKVVKYISCNYPEATKQKEGSEIKKGWWGLSCAYCCCT